MLPHGSPATNEPPIDRRGAEMKMPLSLICRRIIAVTDEAAVADHCYFIALDCEFPKGDGLIRIWSSPRLNIVAPAPMITSQQQSEPGSFFI